jgi:hypothetical protein
MNRSEFSPGFVFTSFLPVFSPSKIYAHPALLRFSAKKTFNNETSITPLMNVLPTPLQQSIVYNSNPSHHPDTTGLLAHSGNLLWTLSTTTTLISTSSRRLVFEMVFR